MNVVREVLTGVYDQIDADARQDNRNAEDALKAAGLRYVRPASDDVEAWRSTLASINARLGAEGVVEPALLEEVLDHLETYRALEGNSPGVSATGL